VVVVVMCVKFRCGVFLVNDRGWVFCWVCVLVLGVVYNNTKV
jgi:hypothetical protein